MTSEPGTHPYSDCTLYTYQFQSAHVPRPAVVLIAGAQALPQLAPLFAQAASSPWRRTLCEYLTGDPRGAARNEIAHHQSAHYHWNEVCKPYCFPGVSH